MSEKNSPEHASWINRLDQRPIVPEKGESLRPWQEWVNTVYSMTQALPSEYEDCLQRLETARGWFYNEIATAFEQRFTAMLESLPRNTIDEKRVLAETANAHLAKLGLTIQCPRTSHPAKLIVEKGTSNEGRLMMDVTMMNGKHRRTVVDDFLFRLTPCDPILHGGIRWKYLSYEPPLHRQIRKRDLPKDPIWER